MGRISKMLPQLGKPKKKTWRPVKPPIVRNIPDLNVGDPVEWDGRRPRNPVKQGIVLAIVPRGTRVASYPVPEIVWENCPFNPYQFNTSKLGGGCARDHVSYLIEVKRVNRFGTKLNSYLYWPEAEMLRKVE